MAEEFDFVKELFKLVNENQEYLYKDRNYILSYKSSVEGNLSNLWKDSCKINEYQKAINDIKETGLKVLRNSLGQHKICE